MDKGVQLTHDCIVHIGSYALSLGSFDKILIPSHVQVSDVMVCREMLACLYWIVHLSHLLLLYMYIHVTASHIICVHQGHTMFM